MEYYDTALRAAGCTNGILKYMLDYTAAPDYEPAYLEAHIKNAPVGPALDRLFGCVAVVAAVLASGHVLAGLPVSPRHAFRGAVSRWWPMLWTGLLAGLVLLGLTLLLIVPGIIWGVYYAFLVPVVAFGLSGTEALAESKRLVKGNWWRTLGCVLVIGLVEAALVLPGVVVSVVYNLGTAETETPLLLDEAVDFLTNVYIDVAALFGPVATAVFFLNRRSVVDGPRA